jgi:hypothetical protein
MTFDERGTEHRCVIAPKDPQPEGVSRYFYGTDLNHSNTIGAAAFIAAAITDAP